MNSKDVYYDKYQKYKSKYLKLKQKGGTSCYYNTHAATGICLADDESILENSSRRTIFSKLALNGNTTIHKIYFSKPRSFIDYHGKKHETKKIIAEVSYYYNKFSYGGLVQEKKRRSHNYLTLSNAFIEVSTSIIGGTKTKIPVKRVISAEEKDNVTTGLYIAQNDNDRSVIKQEPKSIIDLNGVSTEGLQQWLEPIGGQVPTPIFNPNSTNEKENSLRSPFNIQSISNEIPPSDQNYPGTWTWGPPSTNPM